MYAIALLVFCLTNFTEVYSSTKWSTYLFTHDKQHNKIIHFKTTKLINKFNTNDLLRTAFKNSIKENGFSFIDIQTNSKFNNSMQAYSAGFAEGILTKDLIKHKLENSNSGHCPKVSKYCPNVHRFFKENLNFMYKMIDQNQESNYWEQVRLILLQLQGLEDGYNGKENIDLSLRIDPYGLFQLSSDHEIKEILFAVSPESVRRSENGNSIPNSKPLECSALVKLLPDFTDLFVGHATWRPYSTMLKIMKKYHFHFTKHDGSEYAGNKVVYNSEPGYLFSSNDWYIISSGLVTMETTIGNQNNQRARSFVSSQGRLVEWMRNLLANRMATSGSEWCQVFRRHNSGTYNNQWMVVDYNKFVPGRKPSNNDGLLYVLEQIPGLIHYRDMSDKLIEKEYFPSYNYPYFEKVQLEGGFLDKNGKSSYNSQPRAKIFAHYQSNVTDIGKMFKLMRKNDYKHDPLQEGFASHAIASRYDLNDVFGGLTAELFGATDAKVTNYHLHKNFEMVAECGPTHDQVPPFKWSDHKNAADKHAGQPDVFDFKPILVKWLK